MFEPVLRAGNSIVFSSFFPQVFALVFSCCAACRRARQDKSYMPFSKLVCSQVHMLHSRMYICVDWLGSIWPLQEFCTAILATTAIRLPAVMVLQLSGQPSGSGSTCSMMQCRSMERNAHSSRGRSQTGKNNSTSRDRT